MTPSCYTHITYPRYGTDGNPLDLFSYQQLVALRGAVLQLLEVMSKSSNISPSQSTYHGGVGEAREVVQHRHLGVASFRRLS